MNIDTQEAFGQWMSPMHLLGLHRKIDLPKGNRSGGKKPYAVRILGNREKLP